MVAKKCAFLVFVYFWKIAINQQECNVINKIAHHLCDSGLYHVSEGKLGYQGYIFPPDDFFLSYL